MVLNYKQCNKLFRSHVFSMKKMKVSKISATLLFWTKKKTEKNQVFFLKKHVFTTLHAHAISLQVHWYLDGGTGGLYTALYSRHLHAIRQRLLLPVMADCAARENMGDVTTSRLLLSVVADCAAPENMGDVT